MFCPNCDTEMSKEEAPASEGDVFSNWDWYRCPECNWLKCDERMEYKLSDEYERLRFEMLR